MPELVHPAQLDPRLADLTRPPATGFSGGVCRALAQRWQVDPIIVRLVTLALTFAGGAGIALYGWCWLLTPREGGSPPILRWLPAFGSWPRRTQMIIVAVSSLVLVLSVARTTGVGWGPVIVLGALAWAMSRRRRNSDLAATSPSPFTPVPQPDDATGPAPRPHDVRGSHESVEQWRARLSPHAGSTLPTVDLYAPEASSRKPAPMPQKRRISWLAVAVILTLTVVAATIPVIIGLDTAILWAGVTASATAGVLILLFSLISSTRRLPMTLLVVVLMGAVGTGLLAAEESTVDNAPAPWTMSGDHTHTFFGQAPADLDLTGLQIDGTTTVRVDTTASMVQIRLAEPPGNIEVQSDTILVETSYSSRTPTASDLTLVIDGDVSIVNIETVP